MQVLVRSHVSDIPNKALPDVSEAIREGKGQGNPLGFDPDAVKNIVNEVLGSPDGPLKTLEERVTTALGKTDEGPTGGADAGGCSISIERIVLLYLVFEFFMRLRETTGRVEYSGLVNTFNKEVSAETIGHLPIACFLHDRNAPAELVEAIQSACTTLKNLIQGEPS